jgi:hypothetical protein
MAHRYPPSWRGRIPVEAKWRHVAPHGNLPAGVGKEHLNLRGLVQQNLWVRASAMGEESGEDPQCEREDGRTCLDD